jgi:3-methyladenine DNA glycosylase/8-oxoguanine DNA glycosylase
MRLVDSLRLPVTQPFNFRFTLWKPSHFATELELHSRDESWRTFRIGSLVCGVRMQMDGARTLRADVFSDASWTADASERLASRLTHAYGLGEDPSGFLALARKDSAMREPLAALRGMRQSCPENLFEIAVITLVLQNSTVQRSTQMMSNLLDHYGLTVELPGFRLKSFFTPQDILGVGEAVFRARDRLGYRARYLERFAEFFRTHDPDTEQPNKADLMDEFQMVKGVGPYTAAVIASHAGRDPSAIGIDVWNKKILAKRFLGVEEADASAVTAELTARFPGYEGTASLYAVEYVYKDAALAKLEEQIPMERRALR